MSTVPPATQRAATYRALAGLFLEELDEAGADRLRGIAAGAHWSGLARLAAQIPEGPALRELRVEHQAIFGMCVYPYESVFVGEEVMLNTAETARVGTFYRACGFAPDRGLRCGALDHAGVEMLLMAELVEAEHGELEASFFHTHLGAWAPVFCATAAEAAVEPFYRTLAEVAGTFVMEEAGRIRAPEAEGSGLSPAPDDAGAAAAKRANGHGETGGPPAEPGPALAPDEELALQDVIARLVTPAAVGVFLGRRTIVELARGLGLPAGVLERSMMLRNLFQAAGQHERVEALVEALDQILLAADARYLQWSGDHPGWAPHAERWRTRTHAGLELVGKLREGAGTQPPPPRTSPPVHG